MLIDYTTASEAIASAEEHFNKGVTASKAIWKSDTYKYWRFDSWPSDVTSWPVKFAFPRSLAKYIKQFDDQHYVHKLTDSVHLNWAAYTLVTLLSLLHVTWNHVQGFTRVGSQLSNTPLGSAKLVLRAFKASPVLD